MAVLVNDLQNMRAQTARNAVEIDENIWNTQCLKYFLQEEEAQMTRYQEEMLSRVMELHEIAKGGMMANWIQQSCWEEIQIIFDNKIL